VARDPMQAFVWYRRSAERGYFRAQYNYATLLMLTGRADLALGWFEKALAGATAESLGAMTDGLLGQGDLRLAELARRYLLVAEAAAS
jgi:TPR repeat protein